MFLLENTWKFHSFQFEPSKSFTACSPSPTCTWRLFCRHCRDGYRRCPRGLRSPQPRWRPPPPAAEKGSRHRKPCSNSHQLLGHLRHINTQTCSFHLPLSQQSSEALSQEENETTRLQERHVRPTPLPHSFSLSLSLNIFVALGL